MELCFSLSAALNKSNYAYKMTMSAQKTLSPPSIAQHVFFSTAAAVSFILSAFFFSLNGLLLLIRGGG